MQAIEAGGIDLDMGKHVFYYDYHGHFPREHAGLQVRTLCSSFLCCCVVHSSLFLFFKHIFNFSMQGLGVSRRFLEERIRDRVVKEGVESGTLKIVKGKVDNFLIEDGTITGTFLISILFPLLLPIVSNYYLILVPSI